MDKPAKQHGFRMTSGFRLGVIETICLSRLAHPGYARSITQVLKQWAQGEYPPCFYRISLIQRSSGAWLGLFRKAISIERGQS